MKKFKIKKNNLTRLVFFSTLLVGLCLTNYLALAASSTDVMLYDPLGGMTIGGLGEKIIGWLLDLAVPLTAIMTIWGAILLMTTGGDPKKIKQGQNALAYAVGGLVVVMLIEGLFNFGIKTIEQASSLTVLINTIERYLLLIGGPLAIIMFLYGAFLVSTATPDNIKKGKNIFIWTSVALAIISIFSVANLINLINQLAK